MSRVRCRIPGRVACFDTAIGIVSWDIPNRRAAIGKQTPIGMAGHSRPRSWGRIERRSAESLAGFGIEIPAGFAAESLAGFGMSWETSRSFETGWIADSR